MRQRHPISSTNHGRRGGNRPWYWQRRPTVSPLNALNNNNRKGFYFILTVTVSLSTINIQSWECNKIILDQRVLSPPNDPHEPGNTIASVNVEGQGLYFEPLTDSITQELTNTAAATAAMHGRWQWSIDHRHLPCIAATAAAVLVSCCPIGSNSGSKYSPWSPSFTDAIQGTRFIGAGKGSQCADVIWFVSTTTIVCNNVR